jgi:hypothetical protein
MLCSLCSFAIVFMASSQPSKGRGRGRGRQPIHEAGSLSDVVPPPAIPKTTDVDTSSTTDDVQMLATPLATTTTGRGRGHRPVRKVEVEVHDPVWTVSALSKDQFKSKTRPSKPSELGIIGQPIIVRANYFPIAEFPQEGIVYQYDIKIKDKKDRLIRRDHQR